MIRHVLGVLLAAVSVSLVLVWAFFLCVPFIIVGGAAISVSSLGTLTVFVAEEVATPQHLLQEVRAGKDGTEFYDVDLKIARYSESLTPGWTSGKLTAGGTVQPDAGSWRHTTSLDLPLWLALALASPYPFFTFFKSVIAARSRRRRGAAGLCVSCGYNLFGNVTGRCPECGTRVGEGESESAAGASRAKPRSW